MASSFSQAVGCTEFGNPVYNVTMSRDLSRKSSDRLFFVLISCVVVVLGIQVSGPGVIEPWFISNLFYVWVLLDCGLDIVLMYGVRSRDPILGLSSWFGL